jgi:cytoskeleton protein RodZ
MTAKSLQENSFITKGGESPDIKSLREARGLTLDDVNQATKISLKNLEALENGDFHRLPPPVYTRSYLKAYARLLGVDEEQIAGRYEKNLAVSAQTIEEEPEEVSERRSYFSRKIIVNAALVLVLCVLGFFIYSYFNFQVVDVVLDGFLPTKSHDKPVADLNNAAAPVEPTTAASGDAAAPKPPILIIIAREKTWLRITEDQQEAYQLIMQPGERIERSALQYDIDIGNAGGVSVQFQKNIMDKLGKSGEVVHLHLP